MRNYLYDASSPEAHAISHKEIGKKLQEMGKEYPGKYIISWKRHKQIRSMKANAFFHAVCQIYAMYSGHTVDEIKHEFKMARFYTLETDKLGREFKRGKSSSGLDTGEFAAVCNNLLEWGKDEFPAVIVGRKEDMTYIQWLNIQDEYEKVFSGF
jgi:hypothetical protein